jgi:hypothetical protein
VIPSRREVLALVSAFASILATSTSALAQDVTFRFSGTVTETYNSPFSDIVQGTPFTGTYTFNLATPDENSFPSVGDYWHRAAPYGVTVVMGNHVFATNPADVEFLIETAMTIPTATTICSGAIGICGLTALTSDSSRGSSTIRR